MRFVGVVCVESMVCAVFGCSVCREHGVCGMCVVCVERVVCAVCGCSVCREHGVCGMWV